MANTIQVRMEYTGQCYATHEQKSLIKFKKGDVKSISVDFVPDMVKSGKVSLLDGSAPVEQEKPKTIDEMTRGELQNLIKEKRLGISTSKKSDGELRDLIREKLEVAHENKAIKAAPENK